VEAFIGQGLRHVNSSDRISTANDPIFVRAVFEQSTTVRRTRPNRRSFRGRGQRRVLALGSRFGRRASPDRLAVPLLAFENAGAAGYAVAAHLG